MFTQIANHDAALLCVSVILLSIQSNYDMSFILQAALLFFFFFSPCDYF